MVHFLIFFNFLVNLREERNFISGYFKGEEKDSVVRFFKFLREVQHHYSAHRTSTRCAVALRRIISELYVNCNDIGNDNYM